MINLSTPSLDDIALPATLGVVLHSQQGQNPLTSTQPTSGMTYAKVVTMSATMLSGAPANGEFIPPIIKTTMEKSDGTSPPPPNSIITPTIGTKVAASHQQIALGIPSLSHMASNELESNVESARLLTSQKATIPPSNRDSMVADKSEEGEYSVKSPINLQTNNPVGSSQVWLCQYWQQIRPSGQVVQGLRQNQIQAYYNVRSGFGR